MKRRRSSGYMIADTKNQPKPVPNKKPYIYKLVMKDIKARAEVGKEKYGVYLQPNNGRDTLVDLYQELLDGAKYVRQLIYERDGK